MPIGYESMPSTLDAPALEWAAVTPNDSADLTSPCRALWIGTGGAVALRSTGGRTATFANVPDGTLLPVRTARVLSTGTTASGIVALW